MKTAPKDEEAALNAATLAGAGRLGAFGARLRAATDGLNNAGRNLAEAYAFSVAALSPGLKTRRLH